MSNMFRAGGSTHRRMIVVGRWLGLLAFAAIGVVAAARLGQENYWFAPAVLALVVLCMVIIVRLTGKTVRGPQRRRK